MFTTEAPLCQRIERLIDATPKVDPHTHLRASEPAAPDLASLMTYHWLQSELHAVGMPKSDFDSSIPASERVRRALPFLARMRNTAMSWCFHKILRDLYDLPGPVLDDSNYQTVVDRVSANAADPLWPGAVLRDRCNIRAVVTSLGNALGGDERPKLGIDLFHMLDVHYLFCPGVATDLTPFFTGRAQKAEYLHALKQLLGEHPGSARELARRLNDWLTATVIGRTRFSNTFIPIEQGFTQPDATIVDRLLALKRPLASDEIDVLVQFVTWQVLAWHHEHRRAFQIAVGAEYFICDGKSIPRFDPSWTSRMAPVFHNFSNARFDLMMASIPMQQDMAVLARQFPNIYLSGYWWHSFFPALIEQAIALRLQVAPATKICAFLCDAYYCEWTYGKYQLVKKSLARALASLVESRFLEDDALPELLQQILAETPRALYDLDAGSAA